MPAAVLASSLVVVAGGSLQNQTAICQSKAPKKNAHWWLQILFQGEKLRGRDFAQNHHWTLPKTTTGRASSNCSHNCIFFNIGFGWVAHPRIAATIADAVGWGVKTPRRCRVKLWAVFSVVSATSVRGLKLRAVPNKYSHALGYRSRWPHSRPTADPVADLTTPLGSAFH